MVHVAALGEANEMDVLHSALVLAQIAAQRAAAKSGVPPIWWVTHGTQEGTIRSYMHSGLWGLARTFRMEERGVELRCLDLDGSLATCDDLVSDLKHWLVLKGTEAETEVVVTSAASGGSASVSRLSRSKAMPMKATELLMSSRGSLSNLRRVFPALLLIFAGLSESSCLVAATLIPTILWKLKNLTEAELRLDAGLSPRSPGGRRKRQKRSGLGSG